MKNAQYLLSIVILVSLLAFLSCSKSNSGGKPTIKLKSINTDIPLNGQLNTTYEVQSAGAAIDSFVFIRIRLNVIPPPNNTSIIDTFSNIVPDYPDQKKVEYQFYLPYETLHEAANGGIDTFVFKYAVVDKNGHSSDTSLTPTVIVRN